MLLMSHECEQRCQTNNDMNKSKIKLECQILTQNLTERCGAFNTYSIIHTAVNPGSVTQLLNHTSMFNVSHRSWSFFGKYKRWLP